MKTVSIFLHATNFLQGKERVKVRYTKWASFEEKRGGDDGLDQCISLIAKRQLGIFLPTHLSVALSVVVIHHIVIIILACVSLRKFVISTYKHTRKLIMGDRILGPIYAE